MIFSVGNDLIKGPSKISGGFNIKKIEKKFLGTYKNIFFNKSNFVIHTKSGYILNKTYIYFMM